MYKTIQLISFFICIIYFVQAAGVTTFCSAFCQSNTGAGSCTAPSKTGCVACASSVFTVTPDIINYPLQPCQLSSQSSYILNQLSTNPIDISNFTSSNVTTATCLTYQLSGKYVDKDFIQRNLTKIPTNHYQVVIRFNVAYIGTWSATQNLNLNVRHYYGAQNFTWAYACAVTEFLCSGTGLDCLTIKQFVLTHNQSDLFLNFTALYSGSNPLSQYWAIKDLMVISRLCSSFCATCTGPNTYQCTSCLNGYYLNGNICVSVCPLVSIPSLNICASTCPSNYFLNTLNHNCQPCMINCLYCSSSSVCIIWKDSNSNPSSIWSDYLGIWVLLICIGIVLIIICFWKVYTNLTKSKVNPRRIKVNQQMTQQNQEDFQDSSLPGPITGSKQVNSTRKTAVRQRQTIESFGLNGLSNQKMVTL